MEHWDGTTWSLVRSPAGKEPWDFAPRASNDVWMTGDQGNYVTLLEHWDGSAWSVVQSPVGRPGDSELNGATALPAPPRTIPCREMIIKAVNGSNAAPGDQVNYEAFIIQAPARVNNSGRTSRPQAPISRGPVGTPVSCGSNSRNA